MRRRLCKWGHNRMLCFMQHQTVGLLTQWRRVLLQNLQVPQSSRNSSVLWNHQVYYVFTTHHFTLSWVRSIHSTLSRNCFCRILSRINPLHVIIHFVDILQSSSGYAKTASFPRVSPPKSCTRSALALKCYLPRPSPYWFDQSNNTL